MPVKILLADKSITIQKVVEMLFSGKEYEVTCVSDGESALAEASRTAPDVVLADVDLPRVDGYSLAGRFKLTPALAKTPVILMLSRDDVYDAAKGTQSGIVDNIAKPFESQELIGKVKKALAAAPSPPAAAAKAAPPSRPEPAPAPPPPPKPKPAVPQDIFDIIQEAPTRTEVKAAPAPAGEEFFEVEPEVELEAEIIEEPLPAAPPTPAPGVAPEEPPAPLAAAARLPFELEFPAEEPKPEAPAPWPAAARAAEPAPVPAFEDIIPVAPEVEAAPEPRAAAEEDQLFGPAAEAEPLAGEAEKALPFGEKAVEEMREGLGIAEAGQSEIVSFESLDMASRLSEEYAPPQREQERIAPVTREEPLFAPARPAGAEPARATVAVEPHLSEDMLRSVARDVIERVARDVLERVAWEVIPALAEQMIREEIERLKAGK